jgi:hypothetical protein
MTPIIRTEDVTMDLQIVNDEGVRFLVRRAGWNDRHGAVLEIYDLTRAGKGRLGPDGQFVAGYHADTFGVPSPLPLSPAGARGASEEGGLQLRYGVPAWRISAANVQEVRTWIASAPAAQD